MLFQNAIFDLDGTIINSSKGIVKCMQYTFDYLDRPRPSSEYITSLIGPPLHTMFSILLKTKDQDLIDNCIYIFRKRYEECGILDMELYNGVYEMISRLNNLGINVSIATSKPQKYADIILEELKMRHLFRTVIGSVVGEKKAGKAHIVRNVIKNEKMKPSETVMIGDRIEDIAAAKANNVSGVGVTYGYGSRFDLEQANCDFIFDHPQEILNIFEERRRTDYVVL
jgi:phosphoglycolate phosphatase